MNDSQESWPHVAYIETDRFCTDCGYNLRNQKVLRHSELHILLCRCPECGKHHAASDSTTIGSLWTRRFARMGLALWVLTLVIVGLAMCFVETVVMIGTLEEMTRYNYQVGGIGTPTRVLRDLNTEHFVFFSFLGLLSLINGVLMGGGAATFCYHWRRSRYLLLVLVTALLPSLITVAIWQTQTPHLLEIGLKTVATHAALFLAGGTFGALWGRSIARLVVRAILPSKYWQALSDLWLVDNKKMPPPKEIGVG